MDVNNYAIIYSRIWYLRNKFIDAGRLFSPYRYILWGQGETDAFNLMSSEVYINNVLELSAVSSANWGFDRPDWILAKSSIHTVPYSSY